MTDSTLRILVVDDEAPIRKFLRAALAAHGYEIFDAVCGRDALDAVVAHRPDLLILDLGLPDMDGIQVTQKIREWSKVPIIVLSVREQEQAKVAALDAGADDYLTKPFGISELLARIRVAMRHVGPAMNAPIFETGDLRIDFARRAVTVANREVQLTPTEYDLLRVLVTQSNKVLTHRQLLREVWGAGYEEETHMLRVNISNLRRKIEFDPARPRYLITEPGVGYLLRTDS